GGGRGLGALPSRPRDRLAHLPGRSADHHAARAAAPRAGGGVAAGMGGAGHLARRRGPRVSMVNLTHAFAAITCSHAVSRERPSGLTLAAAVRAANVQDGEWLPFVASPAAGLEVQRGTMHSLLAVPLLALVVAAGVHLATRQRGSGAAPPPFRPLLGVCLVAAASHPLLD